jgi:alkanesulfonate monooxygenase SsuD/methylene tetrahydromethanopterin reductase-like flavin-dependent oxidoreductase (luciferase family)
VTAAGNPETFRQAGQIGANMLTHLLGQTIEGLAEKLEIYRRAWREARHRGRGSVTLMLHSFVAEDEAFVRAQVHGPFKAYLRSSTDLLKQHASSFPAFRNAGREGIDGLFRCSSTPSPATTRRAVSSELRRAACRWWRG